MAIRIKRLADFTDRAETTLEGQQWLDVPSYKLENGLALALNLFGGATEPIRNLLHGTWLGHPVHPMLTDVPVGAWSTLVPIAHAEHRQLSDQLAVVLRVDPSSAARLEHLRRSRLTRLRLRVKRGVLRAV